jgi:predicted transcriptional regulator
VTISEIVEEPIFGGPDSLTIYVEIPIYMSIGMICLILFMLPVIQSSLNLRKNSSIQVLRVIIEYGPIDSNEITEKVFYAPRTVRLALRNLKENQLIGEKGNLTDMRKKTYFAKVDTTFFETYFFPKKKSVV